MPEPDFELTVGKAKPGRLRLVPREEPYLLRLNGYDVILTVAVEDKKRGGRDKDSPTGRVPAEAQRVYREEG